MAMNAKTAGIAVAAVVGLGIVGGVVFRTRGPEAPPPAVEAPPTLVEPRAEAKPLPPRSETDVTVRDTLRTLSPDARWMKWIANADLLNRFVGAVDAIADGKSPRQALDFLAPSGRFEAVERDGAETIAPGSYARYDFVGEVVATIDGAKAGIAYVSIRELVDTAYKHFGYPDRRFDERLATALTHLLAVPVLDEDVRLESRGGIWIYADPKLEALTPAQKHLLRMGPKNVERVQAMLRRFAETAHVGS